LSEAKIEYITMLKKTAEELWGEEEVIKISQHLETTAGSVWNISQIVLNPKNEPATKLIHEGKI
jgi:hypothetical protein